MRIRFPRGEMVTMKAGSTRLRLLAAELKHLRDKAGLNVRDAAQLAGLSRASLNRMELGRRVIEPEDMSALLVIYGVRGVERDHLLNLTRQLGQPHWWEIPSSLGLSMALPALIAFESQASRVTQFELLRIPGLLQTPEYIRAIMRSFRFPLAEQDKRIAIRLERQELLTRPKPHFLAILDESVLQRPVGGPSVMVKQLKSLISVSQRPNVDVRVIPLACGAHTGMDGSFVTMEFAEAPPIVYLEHKKASHFLDEPELVAPYLEANQMLMEIALDAAGSLDLIDRMAEKHAKA
nr:Putative DNA-binding protein [Kibdelosporangium sp. MJ126-NF4]